MYKMRLKFSPKNFKSQSLFDINLIGFPIPKPYSLDLREKIARVGFRSLANSNIIDNHIEVVGLRSSVQPT